MLQTDSPRRRPLLAAFAALAAVSLALAACGGAASPTGAASQAAPSAAPSVSAPSDAASQEPASEEPEASAPANGEVITVTNASTFGGVDELSVAVGDTVTFVNESSFPHTVSHGTDGNTVDDPAFDEQLPTGATVEITFDEAGDFDVTCLFHAPMNMVVHVE